MSDTFTFNDSSGRFTFTVKFSFKKKFWDIPPNYFDPYYLNTEYDLPKYLHNPQGPAIIDNETGNVQYWIDGKLLNEEDSKKIAHNVKFNTNLMDILNEK